MSIEEEALEYWERHWRDGNPAYVAQRAYIEGWKKAQQEIERLHGIIHSLGRENVERIKEAEKAQEKVQELEAELIEENEAHNEKEAMLEKEGE